MRRRLEILAALVTGLLLGLSYHSPSGFSTASAQRWDYRARPFEGGLRIEVPSGGDRIFLVMGRDPSLGRGDLRPTGPSGGPDPSKPPQPAPPSDGPTPDVFVRLLKAGETKLPRPNEGRPLVIAEIRPLEVWRFARGRLAGNECGGGRPIKAVCIEPWRDLGTALHEEHVEFIMDPDCLDNPESPEICGNNKDDDGDGKIDECCPKKE